MVVAQGGGGGRGNVHFVTSTNQTPVRWEPGWPGEERRVEVELKLIADVGLVGEPNAGKSTFLAAVSKARPKVADYPFTTLAPNLGIVELPDFRTFAVADIPGIVEGAHEGRGLGLQFLRHIERTRTLALMVPVDAPDPEQVYRELREELSSYSDELGARPHCVVLTKTDLLGPEDDPPVLDAPEAWGVFTVSSVARTGLPGLLEALWMRVREVIDAEATGTGRRRLGYSLSVSSSERVREIQAVLRLGCVPGVGTPGPLADPQAIRIRPASVGCRPEGTRRGGGNSVQRRTGVPRARPSSARWLGPLSHARN